MVVPQNVIFTVFVWATMVLRNQFRLSQALISVELKLFLHVTLLRNKWCSWIKVFLNMIKELVSCCRCPGLQHLWNKRGLYRKCKLGNGELRDVTCSWDSCVRMCTMVIFLLICFVFRFRYQQNYQPWISEQWVLKQTISFQIF